MKHHTLIILLLATLSILSISCYQGGGATGGNINNPEYRIVGTWQITHTYLNGEEIDSTGYHANKPSTFYYFYPDHPLQVMGYHNNEVRYSTTGFWYFSNKNKNLDITFSFLGNRYRYSAEIYKLTRRELIYDYVDERGNHWRLHLNNRSGLAF